MTLSAIKKEGESRCQTKMRKVFHFEKRKRKLTEENKKWSKCQEEQKKKEQALVTQFNMIDCIFKGKTQIFTRLGK